MTDIFFSHVSLRFYRFQFSFQIFNISHHLPNDVKYQHKYHHFKYANVYLVYCKQVFAI